MTMCIKNEWQRRFATHLHEGMDIILKALPNQQRHTLDRLAKTQKTSLGRLCRSFEHTEKVLLFSRLRFSLYAQWIMFFMSRMHHPYFSA
jgi:hypothetical protein